MPLTTYLNLRPSALRILFASVLLALVSACTSTPTADTDFNPSYDFSKVRKIAIEPFKRTSPEAVIISDIQVARINEALSSELRRKGFEVVDNKADADMFLAWHLVTQERADVRTYNTASYYNCWRCGRYGAGVGATDVSVRYYTHGTFITDMVDPVKLQSVWRSVFESRIRDGQNPQEAAERRTAAAQAVLAQFPPTGAPQ